MVEFTRKECKIITKNRGIQNPQDMSFEDLLNAFSRCNVKRKVESIRKKLRRLGLKKIAKIQTISKNELNKTEKLQEKSIDKLKVIARFRRIKNIEKLTKEDLIFTLLKSESSALENNFNDNNINDDDTYDDKIRGKISEIRMVLSRLGNTITNKDRKKFKKDLYEIEKNQNF